ncbi:MAG: hypoxanthine phosphoribosyltransferase [Chloroflexi bacterium]|nr:hypoxanthine phosphoribosyltransferase [Chloroflexota bacterium]
MTEPSRIYLSREDIAGLVERLASEIGGNYRDRSLTLIGVLRGGFVFLADLVRQLQAPVRRVDFVRVESYGAKMVSTGRPQIVQGISRESIAGQDVLIVEDIVDTGATTAAVLRYLRRHGPASLGLCTLLDKPSRRQVDVSVDYVGMTIPDHFVVGYGLDFDERYRDLPDIWVIDPERED